MLAHCLHHTAAKLPRLIAPHLPTLLHSEKWQTTVCNIKKAAAEGASSLTDYRRRSRDDEKQKDTRTGRCSVNAINCSDWVQNPSVDRSHPTHEQLVSCAMALLEDHLPSEITASMILKHAGISKGSLYYHFKDFSDLIETAMVRLFSIVVDENIAVLRELTISARNAADYNRAIIEFNNFAQSKERTDFRLERVRLLGLSASNKRLATKLGVEQSRLTKAYTELFEIAQARGWMRTDIDPHGIAVLIQAMTIGRVVDDISTNPMNLEHWKSLIMKVAENLFVPPNR